MGDGEAETGALATSWHSNKFLNPARDGAVLPILHLNGYKIANPTVLARLSDDDLDNLFRGYGYEPFFVEGSEPADMHQKMAATLDTIFQRIQDIKKNADVHSPERPRWPMIILRSPKGWTGPKPWTVWLLKTIGAPIRCRLPIAAKTMPIAKSSKTG